MTVVRFVVAASIGGVGRHLVAGFLARKWAASTGPRSREAAWLAVVVVNLLGSFALGLVLRSDLSGDARVAVGTAACGTFTTFGTFVLQAVEAPSRRRSTIVVVNVLGAVAAVTLGWWFGARLP